MVTGKHELRKHATSTERCDVKIWSGDCDHGKGYKGDRYLCDTCGVIPDSGHKMVHDMGSYCSGDYDELS
jgi:hypothetical protein